MVYNNEKRKQEIKELLEKRSAFLKIKAQVAELIEPKLFQLNIENLANVRNSIIISGALATMGLLVFGKVPQVFSPVANLLLQLSIILFLVTILIYSFYLKSNLGKGIFLYKKKFDEGVLMAEKAENIINDCLDGKISKEEADKKIIEVDKKIEFGIIRKSSDSKDKESILKYLAITGNMFFVSAIVALVFAFSYDLICIFIKNVPDIFNLYK